METAMLKIAIGIAIALAAWVPLGMADARDIPFQAAILGVFINRITFDFPAPDQP
jgi:hypothetical protein